MIRYPRLLVLVSFSLSLFGLPTVVPTHAQEATPAAECVATTPEENEALAVRYWEEAVWGAQGKIAEVVAPDEIHHWGIGGQTTGFEEFAARWALFNTAFPDLEFTVDLIAAENDLVATLWTATGTQRGEWQGIAPTDLEVTWSGVNIFRIACGLIVESWGEADHLNLRQQLGAADVPAAMATPAAEVAATGAAASPCADDTPAANLAVARRWTEEVFNEQNLAVLDEILAADALHHGAAFPDTSGRDAIKTALERQFAAFPDIALTVDLAIADGDLVFVRWSGPATHDGPFLGLDPTGAPVALTGINVYRLACGQIVEGWSEMNVLQVLMELQEG